MNLFSHKLLSISMVSGLVAILAACASGPASGPEPITLSAQGNFAAGGAVVKSDGVFDGQQLFDPQGQTLPRRGRAGQSTVPGEVSAETNDQMWFNMFRMGQWPDFFDEVQFSRKPEALDQFFRQMTPNTGPFDEQVISDSVARVFARSGSGVLITHSQGGGPGWWTAIKTDGVRGIVAYEPGSGFVFPEGEVPDPMSSGTGELVATAVELEQFRKLTRIPIVIYYGDNIPTRPSDNPGQDNWRVRVQMAQLWVDTINQHGGDAQLVLLPDVGIEGNTHFPFSDLNSDQVAELLQQWLHNNQLDR